jgi:hypothetical protein
MQTEASIYVCGRHRKAVPTKRCAGKEEEFCCLRPAVAVLG